MGGKRSKLDIKISSYPYLIFVNYILGGNFNTFLMLPLASDMLLVSGNDRSVLSTWLCFFSTKKMADPAD
jgi:hypothetical protein